MPSEHQPKLMQNLLAALVFVSFLSLDANSNIEELSTELIFISNCAAMCLSQ